VCIRPRNVLKVDARRNRVHGAAGTAWRSGRYRRYHGGWRIWKTLDQPPPRILSLISVGFCPYNVYAIDRQQQLHGYAICAGGCPIISMQVVSMGRRRTRAFLVAVAVSAAGCAAQLPPATPTPAATVVPQAAANSSASAPAAKQSSELQKQAKGMGYTLVKRDGEDDLYCRTSVKTGSRLQRERVCLTAAELDLARSQTEQTLGNSTMQARPPSGH
jgi:hypothetical protein